MPNHRLHDVLEDGRHAHARVAVGAPGDERRLLRRPDAHQRRAVDEVVDVELLVHAPRVAEFLAEELVEDGVDRGQDHGDHHPRVDAARIGGLHPVVCVDVLVQLRKDPLVVGHVGGPSRNERRADEHERHEGLHVAERVDRRPALGRPFHALLVRLVARLRRRPLLAPGVVDNAIDEG